MQTDAPLLCYLSLPKKLQNGQFDALGNEVPEGEEERVRVVLHELPGDPSPWQCWGVVDRPLAPGQTAQVIFFNVSGSAVPGGAFTEWNGATAEPAIGPGLVSLQSVSRAVDRARIIGRNDTGGRIRAAAGLLFVPPTDPPPKDGPSRGGGQRKQATVDAPRENAPKEARSGSSSKGTSSKTATARRTTPKKAPAKRTAAKRTAAKKSSARKAAAKKTTAKKTPAEKASASADGEKES